MKSAFIKDIIFYVDDTEMDREEAFIVVQHLVEKHDLQDRVSIED